MELKEFIKTAITDITEAVTELQSELNNSTIVNPSLPNPISNGSVDVGSGNQPIQKLEFDVALTTTEATAIDGGAKGGIAIFAAKLGTSQQAQMQNVSRLKFTVPIVLPVVRMPTKAEMTALKSQADLKTIRPQRGSASH